MHDPTEEYARQLTDTVGELLYDFPVLTDHHDRLYIPCNVEGFETVTLTVERSVRDPGLPIVGFNIGTFGNRSSGLHPPLIRGRYPNIEFRSVGIMPDIYRLDSWPASPLAFAILQAAASEYLGQFRTDLGLRGIVHITPYLMDTTRNQALDILGYELRDLGKRGRMYIKGYGTK